MRLQLLLAGTFFCDWGSATFAKVRKFGDKRIRDEVDWFAENKAELLYNADANFSQFERDIDYVRYLVEVKRRTGYPKKFRASFAKNSSERVYQASKMLHDAGMAKGATLSFQSLDENTLAVVKRKNIKLDAFKDLMIRYHQDNVATYSELIIGLPGETYETFAKGIDTLIDSGPGNSIHVYAAGIFPNSEMAEPSYREFHGIKSVMSPVTIYHGTPDASTKHQEWDELSIATKTLPPEDWLRCWRLAWAVQAFHCMNLCQSIAVFCRKNRDISYRQFYEGLLTWADAKPDTMIGKTAAEATQHFRNLADGKPWGIVDQRFGNVLWPVEEGSYLQLSVQSNQFYGELKGYLDDLLKAPELVDDLTWYQETTAVDPYRRTGKYVCRVDSNLHEYIQAVYLGQDVELQPGEVEYEVNVEKGLDGDLQEFGKATWYNRKGGSFQHKDVRRANSASTHETDDRKNRAV